MLSQMGSWQRSTSCSTSFRGRLTPSSASRPNSNSFSDSTISAGFHSIFFHLFFTIYDLLSNLALSSALEYALYQNEVKEAKSNLDKVLFSILIFYNYMCEILFTKFILLFKLQKSRNEASVTANQLRDKLKDLKDKSDVICTFNLTVLYHFFQTVKYSLCKCFALWSLLTYCKGLV